MAKTDNARLIFGDDDYRVGQAVRQTLDEWSPPEQRMLTLETIEGALDKADAVREALDRCLEALLTPAFLGALKTVWLRDVCFLEKHQALNVDAVKQSLKRLSEWCARADGANARLLISAGGIDKRTSFYLACKKSANVLEYSVPTRSRQADEYARGQLAELLKEQDLRADSQVMQAIVERTGADTRQLASEVGKLRAYLGRDSIVTVDVVGDLVTSTRQSMIWDFTDAIGKRNLAAALAALRRLLFQKETSVRLLGMLDGFLRDLILYRHAVYHRWVRRSSSNSRTVTWIELPPEVEQIFSECLDRDPRVANPYRMGILAATAATISMSRLLHWRNLVLQTYRRMFSGNIPPENHMELLLLRMLGKTGDSRRIAPPTAPSAGSGKRP